MKNNFLLLLICCCAALGCAAHPAASEDSTDFEAAFWKLHVGDTADNVLDPHEKPTSTSSYQLNGHDYDRLDFERGTTLNKNRFSITIDKTTKRINSLLYTPLWLKSTLSVDAFLKARNLPAKLDQITDECTHHISIAYLYKKELGLFIQYRINQNSVEHALFLNADSFDRELARLKRCSHGAKASYNSNSNDGP